MRVVVVKADDSHPGFGLLSVRDVIAKSSNVGTANLALTIGALRQQAFYKALGFFEPTQIELVEADVIQAVDNPVLTANIPAEFRDPANHWFGLTTRGRVVYATKDRVSEDAITYEELADPKWKGRICMRDGQHSYNIGLFASMVAHHGADYTEKWLAGLKQNLVKKPDGNDRAQAKAIHAGECDLGLANTYYLGLMKTNEKEPEEKEWAASVKVLFPNAADRGTHVNISGMALAKNAPNKDNAVKLMEFLASDEAQSIYAEQVFEYPVGPNAKVSEIVAGFGPIKADPLPLVDIAANRKTASELVDKVGLPNYLQSQMGEPA